MTAGRDVSIIISCFDEEQTIEECLRRTVTVLPDAEVLVVHGGRDRTADIAENLSREHKGIRVIRNKDDRGKGHGIKVGISEASYDVMVQLDADLQFMPEEIPKVLAPLASGDAQIAFGCRFMRESDTGNYRFSLFRDLGNRIVNLYVSLLAGQRFHDITTGLKAWTRRAIEDIDFKDDGFVYEAEIAMRAAVKRYRVAMVPITYFNRLGGVSGHGSGLREFMSIAANGARILVVTTLIRLSMW